jgi:hypothetical protein
MGIRIFEISSCWYRLYRTTLERRIRLNGSRSKDDKGKESTVLDNRQPELYMRYIILTDTDDLLRRVIAFLRQRKISIRSESHRFRLLAIENPTAQTREALESMGAKVTVEAPVKLD